MRTYWADEAKDFTPWLIKEENLAVLSETLDMDLVSIGMERPVGQLRADIVCRDANVDPVGDSESAPEDGSNVLIENQLEQTNHKHLGQLLTYGAGLGAVTIIWIARTFSDEHRAALEWLNDITDQHFRFFGLEIQLWRIGDSEPAPKFNIISQPNDWTRATRRAKRMVVSPVETLRNRYWTAMAEYMEEKNYSLTLRLPHIKHVYGFAIGKSGFRLQAWISMENEHRIAVRLLVKNKKLFELAKRHKGDVEGKIGQSLEWREQENTERRFVVLYHPSADPADESAWPEQHEWMASVLHRFHDTFKPLVKILDEVN